MAAASLTASSPLLARGGAYRCQDPRYECQQFLQRGEMRGLPRRDMLHAAGHAPLRHCAIRAEVHDKRIVDRQWTEVFGALRHGGFPSGGHVSLAIVPALCKENSHVGGRQSWQKSGISLALLGDFSGTQRR